MFGQQFVDRENIQFVPPFFQHRFDFPEAALAYVFRLRRFFRIRKSPTDRFIIEVVGIRFLNVGGIPQQVITGIRGRPGAENPSLKTVPG